MSPGAEDPRDGIVGDSGDGSGDGSGDRPLGISVDGSRDASADRRSRSAPGDSPSAPQGSLRSLLKGNVGALSATSFLNDAASEMAYPLLPLFLVSVLGAGPAFLGLVEGIAESTASLVKLVGGFLSDRVGRRKILVFFGYGVACLVRPFLALAAAPWHVLVVRFTDRIGKGVRTAPRDALLVDSAPPDRKGTAFGLHRAADHAGSVLGPLLAAGILLLVPGDLRLVFALTAIPGIITVGVLWKGVREIAPGAGLTGTLRASGEEEGPPKETFGTDTEGSGTPRPRGPVRAASEGLRSPGPSRSPTPRLGDLRELGPAFPRYLIVLLLFTLGNASDAFLLLRAQDLGIAATAIPLLWGAFHLSKMIWNVPGGMLSDRMSPQRLILSGWLFYALVYGGFALATTAWHVWALFGVYGLYYGLTESPEKALVAELAPSHLRARAFGVFHFAVGLGALPASLLFGALWQWKGAPAAFSAGAGFAIVSSALLPLALRGRDGPAHT